MLIVDAAPGARPDPEASTKSTVRLMKYLKDDGSIKKSGIEAILEAVSQCMRLAEEYEITQLLVMATSALREAPNGNKVIHKSRTPEEQTEVMKQLSGKAHRVISAVCVIGSDGRRALRCVPTRVLMKKLTPAEIQAYVDGKEWVGCCGYKIEGELAGYVKKIIGSYSGVVGLPLFETKNLLNGAGVK